MAVRALLSVAPGAARMRALISKSGLGCEDRVGGGCWKYPAAAIWPQAAEAWSVRRAERPGDARMTGRIEAEASHAERLLWLGSARRHLTRSAQADTVLVSGEARRSLSLPEVILPAFRPQALPIVDAALALPLQD